jgi:hypothetical protein
VLAVGGSLVHMKARGLAEAKHCHDDEDVEKIF